MFAIYKSAFKFCSSLGILSWVTGWDASLDYNEEYGGEKCKCCQMSPGAGSLTISLAKACANKILWSFGHYTVFVILLPIFVSGPCEELFSFHYIYRFGLKTFAALKDTLTQRS